MRSYPVPLLRLEVAVRWTARVLAVLLVGMVLVFLIAEGGVNPFKLTVREAVLMTFLLSTCTGLVLAWRWPVIGGAIATAGIVLFYAVEFVVAGRLLNNLYFNLMLLAGLLFLLGDLIRRRIIAK